MHIYIIEPCLVVSGSSIQARAGAVSRLHFSVAKVLIWRKMKRRNGNAFREDRISCNVVISNSLVLVPPQTEFHIRNLRRAKQV